MDKSPTFLPWYSRTIVAILAIVGVVGVLPVSLSEFQTGSACPKLGIFPACYIVTLAYSSILISVLDSRFWRRGLFFFGWMPVFLLAATGSFLEILGQNTCPKTDTGWPKCFSSLALASAIFLPVIFNLVSLRQAKKE